MRHQPQGFALIVSLIFLTGLATLASVGLLRAISEVAMTNRFASNLQAFHAAEAGLDALIVENRQAGWGFRTHQGNAADPADPGNPVAPLPNPPLPCPATPACIEPDGDYRLTLVGNQTATVQAWTDPNNSALVHIRSTGTAGIAGTAGISTETVAALFRTGGLLDNVFVSPNETRVAAGQKITILGGSGQFLVDGNLELSTGAYDPAHHPADFKDVTVEAGLINVNGAVIRLSPTLNAKVFFKNPTTAENKEVVKYFDAAETKPFHSTQYASDYRNWLTQGPDFSSLLKELNTGAKALSDLLPGLSDIDAFVDQFKNQATRTITQATDVPCGAGSAKSFANASTLDVVKVVEIDVNLLGCQSGEKILYATVPIRLVNGDQLNAGLTIASVDAVYVQGDFNTTSPKPAAVVSANRVYHLSSTFKDYAKFIDKNKVYNDTGTQKSYSTLAKAIKSFGTTKAAYDAFKANYGDDVRPPLAYWLPEYMEDLGHVNQHMAIVSPMGPGDKGRDHNLVPRYGVLEDGDGDGDLNPGYDPPTKPLRRAERAVLERHGVFINLTDNDPNTLCLNYPSCTQQKPQDYQANVKADNVLMGLQWLSIYDPNLAATPPPGFSQTSGGGSGTQVLWER